MKYNIGDIVKVNYGTNGNTIILRITKKHKCNVSITGDEYQGYVYYDKWHPIRQNENSEYWISQFKSIEKLTEDELMVELL